MPIQSYKDLEAWQLGMKLAIAVYTISARFPRQEMYGLTTQMRRAAVSIPSNISEGHRRSTKAYRHFVRVALGSLAELETQLELARRLEMLPAADHLETNGKIAELGRVLHGLNRSLKRRADREPSP